ncbi:MAG TPA: nucleotidyltransferase family protein [Candidatus Xenobia bacterium]|jgi:NDP-sugar pyrophosphorylase family protein
MKAMILAAGRGTRLGDLGLTTPKCLVRVAGKTLLEHVVDRLKAAGVTSLVINVHHLADQVVDYVERCHGFGLDATLSREEELLGTGGGVWRAAPCLRDQPEFVLHNADIYSELDVADMLRRHRQENALATLAVIDRPTQRYFVFDDANRLVGWKNQGDGQERLVRHGPQHVLAFSGIQVLSGRIFDYMAGRGEVFSLTGPYLDAASAGEALMAYRMDGVYWKDAGTPARLAELEAHLQAGTRS